MMHMFSVLTLLSVIPAALATTHQVDVGAGGALTFTPDQVTAQQGDKVIFTLFVFSLSLPRLLILSSHPKNHTVTQSSFDSPCSPLSGGFDSGL